MGVDPKLTLEPNLKHKLILKLDLELGERERVERDRYGPGEEGKGAG